MTTSTNMKLIFAAIAGFSLSTILAMLIVFPKVKANWYAQGKTEGVLLTQKQIHLLASEHFRGHEPNCKDLVTLAGAKPNVVRIIDCGSYKTLRVERD